jgi:hypothetical protein
MLPPGLQSPQSASGISYEKLLVVEGKARVQLFLAPRPRVPRLVGEAADAGHWPWEHPAFQPLLTFLRAL